MFDTDGNKVTGPDFKSTGPNSVIVSHHGIFRSKPEGYPGWEYQNFEEDDRFHPGNPHFYGDNE